MGQSMLVLLSSSPTFTIRYDQFMFVCTPLFPFLTLPTDTIIIAQQHQVDIFKNLSDFCKRCRNIWGSIGTRRMQCSKVGFIKPSRCLMGWELISLFRLLRLKDALRSTINSKEFFNLNNFKEECCVLNNGNFLDVPVFDVSCFVFYATMRVLRLADQHTTLMDKHYFFILQTDWI